MDRHCTMEPDADRGLSRGRLSVMALLAATALAIYVSYLLIAPFTAALAWSVALVVIAIPVHRRLERWIKRPSLAAAISVSLVALCIVVPTLLIGVMLAREAASGIELIQHRAEDGRWRQVLESNPRVANAAAWLEERVNIDEQASGAVNGVVGSAGAVLQNSIWIATQLLITLFVLFFMLRDRQQAMHSLRNLLPLSDQEADTLLHRVDDTIRATVFGTVVVAIVQGTLGGLMFWFLGLPGALLWGVVMALLALVPVLGAFVVWIPAAVFLAVEGS